MPGPKPERITNSWTPVIKLQQTSPAIRRYFSHVRNIPFTRDPPKLIAHPSCTSVRIRYFALCSFEHPELYVLGGAWLGRGREQNCKVSYFNVNSSR